MENQDEKKNQVDFENAVKDAVALKLGLAEASVAFIGIKHEQMTLDQSLHVQEVAINTTKTVTAVSTAVSTGQLFTPFFYFGIAGLVGSSVAGVSTVVADEIANAVKGSTLNDLVTKAKTVCDKMEQLGKDYNGKIEAQAARMRIDPGTLSAMTMGCAKSIGTTATKEFAKISPLIPNITVFVGSLRNGANAVNAIKLAGTVTTVATGGGRASVAIGSGLAASVEGMNFANQGGQAVLAGVRTGGIVVSKFGAAMGALGVVFSVGDCVYSWIVGNPKRAELKGLITQIDSAMEGIINFRKLAHMDA